MMTSYKAAPTLVFICTALLLALALRTVNAEEKPRPKPDTYERIACTPIDRFQSGSDAGSFGALTFIGGCALRSSSADFGGFSGLVIGKAGKTLMAVTDRGRFLSATVERDGRGRIRGLAKARLTVLRDAGGAALSRSGRQDVEGLAMGASAGFLSSERNHGISPLSWPKGASPFNRTPVVGKPIVLPAELKGLGHNAGLEALALAPARGPLGPVLVAIGERGARDTGVLPGAYLQAGLWHPFRIRRSDRFDATDADFLPNGDLILLERRFNLRDLLGMRLRRFPGAALSSGGIIDGDVLLQAGTGHQIDNMEGLSIYRNGRGQTVLALISDNNFSGLQRTLFLEFLLEK